VIITDQLVENEDTGQRVGIIDLVALRGGIVDLHFVDTDVIGGQVVERIVGQGRNVLPGIINQLVENDVADQLAQTDRFAGIEGSRFHQGECSLLVSMFLLMKSLTA
jgi:hypothetical protein